MVELPRNYLAMVETLIRKQRSESAVLQGWLGPRRFEDLPIAQLPDSHSDPKVQDGLGRIKELDEKLADKTMEALIVARETYPDKWAEVRQGEGSKKVTLCDCTPIQESKRMERLSKSNLALYYPHTQTLSCPRATAVLSSRRSGASLKAQPLY